MVLGKLSVPGRPTNLDNSRARAYCACSRCGCSLFEHFFLVVYLFSFLSPSLRDGRLPRGRKRRERIEESKNVKTIPIRTYCKRNRPLPYSNPNL